VDANSPSKRSPRQRKKADKGNDTEPPSHLSPLAALHGMGGILARVRHKDGQEVCRVRVLVVVATVAAVAIFFVVMVIFADVVAPMVAAVCEVMAVAVAVCNCAFSTQRLC